MYSFHLSDHSVFFVTHSVPDGVLNGGVGTIGCNDGSTEPGGRVKFSLFFDILLMVSMELI